MKHNFIIAREGFPFIAVLAVAAGLAFMAGMEGFACLFSVFTLFVVWFFRNPQRKTPDTPGLVMSPADGRVIRIEETATAASPGHTFQKISIFMSVFNVHVNRIPYSGRIKSISYRKGKFLAANLDKASELNERNTIVMETNDGREIVTVQIAGLIARRIVCWLNEGMQVCRGERFGLIRFGSRVEVFLPLDSKLLVKVGDKVKAGETPIGEMT